MPNLQPLLGAGPKAFELHGRPRGIAGVALQRPPLWGPIGPGGGEPEKTKQGNERRLDAAPSDNLVTSTRAFE